MEILHRRSTKVIYQGVEVFSPIQEKIIEVLGTKKMKVTDIAKEVYKGSREKPLVPSNAIISAISYINLKCMKNKLNWRIEGEGSGRNGKTVYVKKVK